MKATLVLLRHGQSVWNQQNIFTGWVDVELSEQGRQEAEHAKILLKDYQFDEVFCSSLKRAQETARIVLGDHKAKVFCDAALNERRYGELEGKNKDEVRAQFGAEQVKIWRRSFLARPPGGESLADTCARVVPFYEREIKPLLKKGHTVLVAAHGNSLRALVKHLENVSDEEIVTLEIPTGVPVIYNFDEQDKPTRQ